MEADRIQELIAKYNAMIADPMELREIERLIEAGIVDIADLVELKVLDDNLTRLEDVSPPISLDHRFYAMMDAEKKAVGPSTFSWRTLFDWQVIAPRLAFASVALIVGFIGGSYLGMPGQKDAQIREIGKEVTNLKEIMMLSMLEKESPTERLKAVSLTQDMDQASRTVTNALLQTLNNDDNVNVRLAALDALRPYSLQSDVREALIRSISRQDSPLVQVALAELMEALQAKSSVKELQKIIRDSNTPGDVKRKIQRSIEVLS